MKSLMEKPIVPSSTKVYKGEIVTFTVNGKESIYQVVKNFDLHKYIFIEKDTFLSKLIGKLSKRKGPQLSDHFLDRALRENMLQPLKSRPSIGINIILVNLNYTILKLRESSVYFDNCTIVGKSSHTEMDHIFGKKVDHVSNFGDYINTIPDPTKMTTNEVMEWVNNFSVSDVLNNSDKHNTFYNVKKLSDMNKKISEYFKPIREAHAVLPPAESLAFERDIKESLLRVLISNGIATDKSIAVAEALMVRVLEIPIGMHDMSTKLNSQNLLDSDVLTK